MNRRAVLTVLSILALASAPAFAREEVDEGQGHPGRHGHGPGGFADLNLSQDQKDQLHALRKGEKGKLAAQHEQLARLHRDLRAEVFSDTPDESKIQALKGSLLAVQSDLLASRVDMDKRIAALLTPEQREKLRSAAGRDPGAGGWRGHKFRDDQ